MRSHGLRSEYGAAVSQRRPGAGAVLLELSYGDIGIFYVPGMGGIKQVAHDRLHSLNPDFDDIFPYEDGAAIIGRVLGKITADMIPDADDQALYLEARESC